MREVIRTLAVARAAEERQLDRDLRVAWYAVVFHSHWRAKKLKPLTTYLSGTKPAAAKPQSVDQMRSMLHTFSRLYGGKVGRRGV